MKTDSHGQDVLGMAGKQGGLWGSLRELQEGMMVKNWLWRQSVWV